MWSPFILKIASLCAVLIGVDCLTRGLFYSLSSVIAVHYQLFLQEQLVMVELSGIIDSDFLEKCENKCKILVSDYSTIGKG